MNKTAERPPILAFMLAFAGLMGAALWLAALAPTPEHKHAGASALEARSLVTEALAAQQADRSAADRAR